MPALRAHNTVKQRRNSSIELLRIIMMLQIVFLHICDYGEYRSNAIELGGSYELIMWCFWLSSRCPVYMFILITGYFMVNSEAKNNFGKIRKVYLPMYFYSLLIPIVVGITGTVPLKIENILSAFFPLLSRTWYFMTLYVLILILSPYLNLALCRISKREYQFLLFVLFFLFSIWELFANLDPISKVIQSNSIFDTDGGKSLYGFVFMYTLGGFLRRFVAIGKGINTKTIPVEEKKIVIKWPNFCNLIAFLVFGMLNVLLVYIVPDYDHVVGYNNNPFVVLQCVFLFLFFANFRFYAKWINCISALNLGVYMIHDHDLIRVIIWDKLLNIQNLAFYQSHFYLIKIALICIAIYAVCACLEWLRSLLFRLCHYIYHYDSKTQIPSRKK